MATPTHYTYNLDKQLTAIERPDGKTVTLNYNSGGKLDTLTTPRGAYRYGYDATSGKLTTVTTPEGTLRYGYDGFLPTGTTWAGDISGTVSQGYDNTFQVTERRVNGIAINYGYDNDGLLISAGDISLSRTPVSGLLSGTTLGNIGTSRSYNGFGETDRVTATVNGNALYTTTYQRDKGGRITQKVETIDGTTTTYDYGYDAAGRLETVKENGTTVSRYTYDGNGNRLGYAGSAGIASATYDAQDRLQTYGNASYAYTQNGELIAKSENGATTRYDYDVLGNLRQVTLPGDDGQGCPNVAGAGCTGATMTIDYLIDGQNRRIGKKVNGQLVQGFLYQDTLNPIAELDGGGNVIARFVYAEKSNVPSYMVKERKTYRILSDHLGSPRIVVISFFCENCLCQVLAGCLRCMIGFR